MKFTDFPRAASREDYGRAIETVLRPLRSEPQVQAVFQVGGIRSPGISDVDLLVIFTDDARCALDPLAGLSAGQRYFFPHGQFGLSGRHFAGAVRFGFFHDYKLLLGEDPKPVVAELSAAERDRMNRQVALEYLVRLFVSMSVERTYGIVKVRNLLLVGRALSYDLDYLGATDSPVGKLVDEVVAWRDRWFEARPRDREIRAWFETLYRELEALLRSELRQRPLYLPEWADRQIAGNMSIAPAADLGVTHRGVTLPSQFGGLGRRYFNLQHRFNRFCFNVPVTADAEPVLRERHELVAEMGEHNRENLPHFTATPMPLGIFRRRASA